MTMKATKLTEKSWILNKRSGRFGLMRKVGEDYAIMGGPFSGTYEGLEKVEKRIGDKIKFNESKVRSEVEETSVEGYPVKHPDVFDILLDDETYTYSKKEGSKDRYGAGYFCLQFKGKWVPSFCPRFKTLTTHPSLGPFKSKLEMEHTINVENNK